MQDIEAHIAYDENQRGSDGRAAEAAHQAGDGLDVHRLAPSRVYLPYHRLADPSFDCSQEPGALVSMDIVAAAGRGQVDSAGVACRQIVLGSCPELEKRS